MHALVWVKNRSQRAHLAFAVLAVWAALHLGNASRGLSLPLKPVKVNP